MRVSVVSVLAFAIPIFAAAGDGDWAAAYPKAKTALAKLSNANKVSLATGISFPKLCPQDGPLGVRYAQQVTAFQADVTTGSIWDASLMYARGNALAMKFYASGGFSHSGAPDTMSTAIISAEHLANREARFQSIRSTTSSPTNCALTTTATKFSSWEGVKKASPTAPSSRS